MDSLIYVGLGALAGLIIGIVEKCKERKNPPPVQPVKRSRRQKSGLAVAADVLNALERMSKRAYDIGVLRKPF